MKYGNEYWGLPTAVCSLALFYNETLLTEAGLDPNKPPRTIDQLVDAAKKTVKYDIGGNITSEGLALDMGAQDHHWWREVLVREFGGAPYSDDYRKVAYNDEHGVAALKWYTDLQTADKVGPTGFMDVPEAAFEAGRAALMIDGSFRLGSLGQVKNLAWGVSELPTAVDGARWISSLSRTRSSAISS